MPDVWKSEPIGSLVQATFSGCWGIDPHQGRSSTTVLRATDIDDDGHVNLESGAQRQLSVRDLATKRLLPGDILLEASGGGPGKPVGRPARFHGESGQEYVTSNFFKVLRPNLGRVDAGFLAWKLLHLSKLPDIWRFQQQTTGIINLKFADYLDHEIAIPVGVDEQARIAQVLDAVDEQIRLSETFIAKLVLQGDGLRHDLLTRGVGRNGEIRDPIRHPEQFKTTEAGLVPTSWSVETVDDRFDIKSGITLGPHRRPRHNSSGYLRVANVRRASIDLADIAQLQASLQERQEYALRAGDLLVVEGHGDVGQIGRCARVTPASAGLLHQNHLFRLRSRGVEPVFAEAWLNSAYAKGYWRATCSTSSGLNTINSRQLKAMRCAVPEADEQRVIARLITTQEQRLDTETRLRRALVATKDGLMADLLTGRVRVPIGAPA